MLFRQSSAPVGWTKDTSINDAALRVVSGSVSSGGSAGFAAAFAAGVTAGNTTLTVDQIPSHTHTATVSDPGHTHNAKFVKAFSGFAAAGGECEYSEAGTPTTASTTGISVSNALVGGGQAHNHSLPMANLKYVDVIVATKD